MSISSGQMDTMTNEASSNHLRSTFTCYYCRRGWNSFNSIKGCVKRCFDKKMKLNVLPIAASSNLKSTRIIRKPYRRAMLTVSVRPNLLSNSDIRFHNQLGQGEQTTDLRAMSSHHFATRTHDCSVIQLLLECGADVHKRNTRGETALHVAARSNCPSAVQRLSEASDVNYKSFTGETPLHIAILRGYADIVDMLLKTGATFCKRDLKIAVESGDINVLNVLRDNGVNLDDKDKNGETPLHWAVAAGNAAVVTWLLDLGLDINAKNRYGWTPLHFPAYFGNLHIAKLLVNRGAKLNTRTKVGFTPLSLSVNCKRHSVREFLESKGGVMSFC